LLSNCCREMRCHLNPSKNMIENRRWKGYAEEKMGDGWSIPGSRQIWWTLALLAFLDWTLVGLEGKIGPRARRRCSHGRGRNE
jgi:hypothetical protein